jgi:hypothetical protein
MSFLRSLTTFTALACFPLLLGASTVDNFVLTDGTDTVTFSLPSSPTPAIGYAGEFFVLNGVNVIVDGTPLTANLDFYNFTHPWDGGVNLYQSTVSSPIIEQEGPQLYSGSETAPTFLIGVFNLTQYPILASGEDIGNYTLTITSATPTPEPSSFVLLGIGLMSLSAGRWGRNGFHVRRPRSS